VNSIEVVELVAELEAEVNNGGLHQYFNNSSGDNASKAVLALETIGALNAADILRRANARFPEGSPPKERRARLGILWDRFPKAIEFRDLDGEFFAYPDDLSALLTKYKGP
jgi:hypothetical protein